MLFCIWMKGVSMLCFSCWEIGIKILLGCLFLLDGGFDGLDEPREDLNVT